LLKSASRLFAETPRLAAGFFLIQRGDCLPSQGLAGEIWERDLLLTEKMLDISPSKV
jgi:hypothetical protein